MWVRRVHGVADGVFVSPLDEPALGHGEGDRCPLLRRRGGMCTGLIGCGRWANFRRT